MLSKEDIAQMSSILQQSELRRCRELQCPMKGTMALVREQTGCLVTLAIEKDVPRAQGFINLSEIINRKTKEILSKTNSVPIG